MSQTLPPIFLLMLTMPLFMLCNNSDFSFKTQERAHHDLEKESTVRKASLRPIPIGSLFIASFYFCGMGIGYEIPSFPTMWKPSPRFPVSFFKNVLNSDSVLNLIRETDPLKVQCILTTSINVCDYPCSPNVAWVLMNIICIWNQSYRYD